MIKSFTSRRTFLGAMAALGAGVPTLRTQAPLLASLAGLGALAQHQRASAAAGSYRALVCLFMAGGNDGHNWVVPTDPEGYAAYAAARGALAYPAEGLLPITCINQGSGRSFGMPQELAPLHNWYEQGRLALVANVGTLVRPISLSDYQSGTGVPPRLFSHSDQQTAWQSDLAGGGVSGWAGRMGDLLMASNQNPVFTAVSAAGNVVFLNGANVVQYQVGLDGPVAAKALGAKYLFGSSSAPEALRSSLADPGTNALQAEYVSVVQRALAAQSVLGAALQGSSVAAIPSVPLSMGSGPSTLDRQPLARQLRIVAQMIGAAQALGMRRQVFLVQASGFDTHANQLRDGPGLMQLVAQSTQYFLDAMTAMGQLDNVLLFSASDFGRTLVSNGSGCDHGWGSHHFVAGGGVRGRQMFGRFPVTALGTDTDVGSGRLLPTTSVTQLAAALGRWFGLSDSELVQVLPSLPHFSRLAPLALA